MEGCECYAYFVQSASFALLWYLDCTNPFDAEKRKEVVFMEQKVTKTSIEIVEMESLIESEDELVAMNSGSCKASGH